jgi:hypothetical protein
MIHIKWETTSSPAGDFLASPNIGICDTTLMQLLHTRFIYKGEGVEAAEAEFIPFSEH